MNSEQAGEHLLDLLMTWAYATEALLSFADLSAQFATAVEKAAAWPDERKKRAGERALSGELGPWIFNPEFIEEHRRLRIEGQTGSLPDLDAEAE